MSEAMSAPGGEIEATAVPEREMLDRYELITLLARGGMGSVYLARLPGAGGFQRLYAIKVMHPHLAEETEFVGMLLDEARIAARIHHPNAVPIVDVCHSTRGFYLVMDYIDGVTLARLLSATTTLPWRERTRAAIRVIIDALSGLHAAHELTDDDGRPLGIVHRDVSPQNIMAGADGVGRITDFGIALAASRIVASRPGLIKGKPSYMSPEQVSAAIADRRADVFAMGIVLWEALTNKRLFQAEVEGRLSRGGPHLRAAARAMAVLHVNGAMGVVCAAPTGGAAGTLPGTVVTLAEERHLDRKAIAKALFAAGAIGTIVATRATFAAEVAGCQVEIGAAGAMAAAAVVEAMGGSAAQACHAAAIAFQNTMGSVCDLVQGIVEIPCHTRNAVAAANAFLCADIVLGGYANPVPLDETIDAVYAVGKMLPAELRCTAKGGLAVAPSAQDMRPQISCSRCKGLR